MLKVKGNFQIMKPGEWRECYEVIHEGFVRGFVEHEKTAMCETIRTRNIHGEIMDGERLDWLINQVV